MRQAEKSVDIRSYVDSNGGYDNVEVEWAEEIPYALVDVAGDEAFELSRWVHMCTGTSFGGQLLTALRDLVTWSKSMWLQYSGNAGYPQPLCNASDLIRQIEDELKAQKGPPCTQE